jgi:hypothetical protein
MTHFLNATVWVGFIVTLTGAFTLTYPLFMGGATVWGIASLIDYARN